MHLGSFDKEPETVVLMDEYIEQNGYVNDINGGVAASRDLYVRCKKSCPGKVENSYSASH